MLVTSWNNFIPYGFYLKYFDSLLLVSREKSLAGIDTSNHIATMSYTDLKLKTMFAMLELR